MYIDSSLSNSDITNITCGFLYQDGSFYGTDEYKQGEYTHEDILQHYSIKEAPGVIRFCTSFIMLESTALLSRRFNTEYPQEYNVTSITEEQSVQLRKWLSSQKGKITCPTISDKEYQFRYLESLDDKLLSNIIML